MAHIEIHNPVSIRGETSIPTTNATKASNANDVNEDARKIKVAREAGGNKNVKEGKVYRVYGFEYDGMTVCYHLNGDLKSVIPCSEARTMIRNGILPGFAHDPRSIVCEEFQNNNGFAAKAIIGAIGVSALVMLFGRKDQPDPA